MNVWLFVYEKVKSARQKTFERATGARTHPDVVDVPGV